MEISALLLKRLLQIVLPGAGGGGAIALTMHLTNTAGNLFDSLTNMVVPERPDPLEEEIIPVEKPEEPSQTEEKTQEEQSDDSDQQTEQQSGGDQQQSQQDTQNQNSASTTNKSGKTEITEVIKHWAGEIHSKGGGWASRDSHQSLTSLYELINSTSSLLEALQQYSATSTNGSEGSPSQ